MQPLIVSYSGIRGIVGESLTADVAADYGRAFGRLVIRRHPKPLILLGRDTRVSGPELLDGAVRGLSPFGVLVDLKVVATPTLQHSLAAFGAQAALCITASHNPGQWNGLKLFLAPDNVVLDGEQIKELRLLVEEDPSPVNRRLPPMPPNRHHEAVRMHVAKVCAQVDVAAIRAAALKVAVDSGRGAGEEATESLLRELGCVAVPVRAVRESEPIPDHLGDLRRAVVAEGCALGVAQDLDADRLALVSEEGTAPGEELTLVLAVDHLLHRSSAGPRVVVKNIATTSALDEVVARHGARLVETPVGEVNLSRALAAAVARGDVAFGGEGNGGVIYPPVHLGRDSLVGIAFILERLARDRRPLSRHLADMPTRVGRKDKAPLAGDRAALTGLFARVEAAFPGGEPSRLDGLRLRFADGSWLGLRPSNTEPIVRLVAESKSGAWVEETMGRLQGLARV